MKNKRNLYTKLLLLQNDQNADTTLLHSHDEMGFPEQQKSWSVPLTLCKIPILLEHFFFFFWQFDQYEFSMWDLINSKPKNIYIYVSSSLYERPIDSPILTGDLKIKDFLK